MADPLTAEQSEKLVELMKLGDRLLAQPWDATQAMVERLVKMAELDKDVLGRLGALHTLTLIMRNRSDLADRGIMASLKNIAERDAEERVRVAAAGTLLTIMDRKHLSKLGPERPRRSVPAPSLRLHRVAPQLH